MKTRTRLLSRLLFLTFAAATLSPARSDFGCHSVSYDVPGNIYTTPCTGPGYCRKLEWYPLSRGCTYSPDIFVYCKLLDEYGRLCKVAGVVFVTAGTCVPQPDGSWSCVLGSNCEPQDTLIITPCYEGLDFENCLL